MKFRVHRTVDGFWAVNRGITRVAVLLTWRDAYKFALLKAVE